MTIVLALFIFLGGSLGVNRLSHQVEFREKNKAWVAKNFPGSRPPSKLELWENCLDGSPECQIVPEIEKAERRAAHLTRASR